MDSYTTYTTYTTSTSTSTSTHYNQYNNFPEVKFRRITGLTKKQFNILLPQFIEYTTNNWDRRGKKGNFTLPDKLLLTFRYLRSHPTYIELANEFGISESYAQKIFTKVSTSLVQILKLPNLKDIQELKLETIVIDVSEQETERPKKNKD